MATRQKASAAAKKQPPAKISSETIAEQTRAFLEGGGKIEYVDRGVSGYRHTPGPKHITLGSKPG